MCQNIGDSPLLFLQHQFPELFIILHGEELRVVCWSEEEGVAHGLSGGRQHLHEGGLGEGDTAGQGEEGDQRSQVRVTSSGQTFLPLTMGKVW